MLPDIENLRLDIQAEHRAGNGVTHILKCEEKYATRLCTIANEPITEVVNEIPVTIIWKTPLTYETSCFYTNADTHSDDVVLQHTNMWLMRLTGDKPDYMLTKPIYVSDRTY